MRALLGFAAGLVFGLGLVVSGMSDPAKVLNFLDLAGTWDPSLALVMAGATGTTLLGYRLVWRRSAPVLLASFDVPTRADVDPPLLVGAGLFGLGWGIAGFCPGPAWTALATVDPAVLAFLAAMVAGLLAGGPLRGALSAGARRAEGV